MGKSEPKAKSQEEYWGGQQVVSKDPGQVVLGGLHVRPEPQSMPQVPLEQLCPPEQILAHAPQF